MSNDITDLIKITSRIEANQINQSKVIERIESQVMTLEAFKNQAKGGYRAVAAISAVAGTVGGYVANFFSQK